ncbi:non-heme iron oxygenase ferredoxin subunit [Cupriavidus basilensis]|uniref:non-heme iron oxygenase ferredoxin subunit n=1 Tax=Cupriavidus basilensis TaxID=68895 RepID=UPI0039F6AFA7
MTTTEHVIHFLCRKDEVPNNEAKRVLIADHPPLAVFNLSGAYYVTDDKCTHGEASLCEGEVDGVLVECPFHQGAFDIRTGKAAGAPCSMPLKTYEVIMEGDGVCIRSGK